MTRIRIFQAMQQNQKLCNLFISCVSRIMWIKDALTSLSMIITIRAMSLQSVGDYFLTEIIDQRDQNSYVFSLTSVFYFGGKLSSIQLFRIMYLCHTCHSKKTNYLLVWNLTINACMFLDCGMVKNNIEKYIAKYDN